MKRMLFATMMLAGGMTAASAQTPMQQQAPNMPAPKDVPAEKFDRDDPLSTGSTNNLSDRLERSDGVIRPPETGTPDMNVPAPVPDPGTTPVIPPPGTPGGNENVDPK